MTINQAIQNGMQILQKNNITTPKMKSRLLLQYTLKKSRQYIIANDNKQLTDKEEGQYFDYIKLMKSGMPLEYITHSKEFMKLNFFVDNNVLIPRQDTEILVEEIISIAQQNEAKYILDLCTGSGAIAVSMAKYLGNVNITAIDISKKALEIAKKNAKRNQVENKIEFIESNMFENLDFKKYDIIVSNPPYIEREEIKKLEKEVQNEPLIALDGGKDGLEFYRKIIKKGYKYLNPNGYIGLEIGYNQKIKVEEIIKNNNMYINTYCKKDLYDNDRIIITQLKD